MEKNKIIKIAIIGAESTGKSTLAKQLAAHFNTVYVSEYARDYFDEHTIENYSINVFDIIYSKQINNETEAEKKAKRFLFCDTTLITGKIWSEEIFNKTAPFIEEHLPKINYALYLVTNNEVPWEKDHQRKNPHNREELLQRNLDELKKLNATYKVVEGMNEARLHNAIKYIEELFGIN